MSAKSTTNLGQVAKGGALLAAGSIALNSAPALSWFFPITKRLFPHVMGVRPRGEVGLSFDDGPDPASTPAILDLLGQHGVRATFFMLGSMAAQHPSVARQVALAGHEIGLHGHEHRNSLYRSPRTLAYDLARGKEEVEAATGVAVSLMRPPYGVISASLLLSARRLGLHPRLWTTWGRDWRAAATPETVISDLVRHGIDGGTVLLHDSDCTSAPGSTWSTLGGLEMLIHLCQDRDLSLVPLGAPS